MPCACVHSYVDIRYAYILTAPPYALKLQECIFTGLHSVFFAQFSSAIPDFPQVWSGLAAQVASRIPYGTNTK
jgi:hypothetical protein